MVRDIVEDTALRLIFVRPSLPAPLSYCSLQPAPRYDSLPVRFTDPASHRPDSCPSSLSPPRSCEAPLQRCWPVCSAFMLAVRLESSGHPEPKARVRVGRVVDVAARDAAVERDVAPAAAPEHPVRAR